MRVLIDTNILIYCEDDRYVSPEISNLIKILSRTHTNVLLHPASLKDSNRSGIPVSRSSNENTSQEGSAAP